MSIRKICRQTVYECCSSVVEIAMLVSIHTCLQIDRTSTFAAFFFEGDWNSVLRSSSVLTGDRVVTGATVSARSRAPGGLDDPPRLLLLYSSGDSTDDARFRRLRVGDADDCCMPGDFL